MLYTELCIGVQYANKGMHRCGWKKKESFTRWALSAVATPGTSSSFIFLSLLVGVDTVSIVCGSLLLDP